MNNPAAETVQDLALSEAGSLLHGLTPPQVRRAVAYLLLCHRGYGPRLAALVARDQAKSQGPLLPPPAATPAVAGRPPAPKIKARPRRFRGGKNVDVVLRYAAEHSTFAVEDLQPLLSRSGAIAACNYLAGRHNFLEETERMPTWPGKTKYRVRHLPASYQSAPAPSATAETPEQAPGAALPASSCALPAPNSTLPAHG